MHTRYEPSTFDSIPIGLPSWKFIGLTVTKTWLIFGHGEAPGDLLTLKLLRNVSRGSDNLPALILVFLRLFVVKLWTNVHQSDDTTVLPRPLTSLRVSVMRVIEHSISVPSLKFICLPFRRCGAFHLSVNRHRDLDL